MPDEYKSLLTKLQEIAGEIDRIPKRGENKSAHYFYVTAADVQEVIRKALLERNILVVPGVVPGSVRHEPAVGGRGMVTTVDLVYRFFDLDNMDTLEIPWAGVGADIGGDKGIYKAYTGALKYVLLNLFLIPTGDDPETDRTTEEPSEPAEREAAPRIPRDRATAILNTALKAELMKLEGSGPAAEYVMEPVFKAKLATHGVDRIGHLNVDQAEDVEHWLAAEVAS